MKKKLLFLLVSIILFGCTSLPEVNEEENAAIMTFEEYFSDDFYFSEHEVSYSNEINSELSNQILPVMSVETTTKDTSTLKNISGYHIIKGNTVNIKDTLYTSFRLKDKVIIENSPLRKEYKIKNSKKMNYFIRVISNGGSISVNNEIVENNKYFEFKDDIVVQWELSNTSQIRIDLVLYSDDSTENLDFQLNTDNMNVFSSEYSYILSDNSNKENFISSFSIPKSLMSINNKDMSLNIGEVIWNNYELYMKLNNRLERLDIESDLTELLTSKKNKNFEIIIFPKNIPNENIDNSEIKLDLMFNQPDLNEDKILKLKANSKDIKKIVSNSFSNKFNHHYYEVPGIVYKDDLLFDKDNIDINLIYYSMKEKFDKTIEVPLSSLKRKISEKEEDFNIVTEESRVSKYNKKPRFIISLIQVVPSRPDIYNDYEFIINNNAIEDQEYYFTKK